MIIPISIFIPNFNRTIRFGSILLRKISKKELRSFFGVKVRFNKNQQPYGITSLPNKNFSIYEYLFPSDTAIFHSTGFIQYPYFVIEALSYEIVINLLFIIRIINPEKHILAPFGFVNNTTNIFHPTITTDKHCNYILNPKKIKEIRHLLAKLQKIQESPKYKIIRDRYLNILEYKTDEKIKYIELVSIIECIILNKNDINKKEHRSTRFKNQLQKNLKNSITKTQADKIYEIRSELSHEGICNKNINSQKSKYSLLNVHIYTTKILKKYIEQNIKEEV